MRSPGDKPGLPCFSSFRSSSIGRLRDVEAFSARRPIFAEGVLMQLLEDGAKPEVGADDHFTKLAPNVWASDTN